MNKRIAITFQNLVQFYSIENGIKSILKNKIPLDIYVPSSNDLDYKNMYDFTAKHIEKYGYKVNRIIKKNIKYKIVLEADYMEDYFRFNSDFIIKYKYGVSVKPNLSFQPYHNIIFDGILCYSTYERDLLSIYSKTWLVGNLKYANYHHTSSNSKKKNVLYLPTYNNVDNAIKIIEEFAKLKEKYNLIIKMHHGTSHIKKENELQKIIKSNFQEIYDHSTNLTEILNKVDIVISDNSGSIFEAIYGDVPVGIITSNKDMYTLESIFPLQDKYIKNKSIPYTNNYKKIEDIIKKCLSTKIINEQKKIKRELFPLNNNELIENFWNIINYYLNKNADQDKLKLKKAFVKEYYNYANNFPNMRLENEFLKEVIEDKNNQIEYYIKTIEQMKKEENNEGDK